MNLNLDFLSLPLLGASALIFANVLVGVFSKRLSNIALVITLLDGSLRTDYPTFRTGLKPALVLASLLLQGSTIGWFAHRMGVVLPDKNDTDAVRATFGDFALQANTRVSDLCDVYGLQAPPDADLCLDAWLAKAIMRPVVVGDQVALDGAKLSVRTMSGGVVTSVGLKLPSPSEQVD